MPFYFTVTLADLGLVLKLLTYALAYDKNNLNARLVELVDTYA